jgi:hypothetical protein
MQNTSNEESGALLPSKHRDWIWIFNDLQVYRRNNEMIFKTGLCKTRRTKISERSYHKKNGGGWRRVSAASKNKRVDFFHIDTTEHKISKNTRQQQTRVIVFDIYIYVLTSSCTRFWRGRGISNTMHGVYYYIRANQSSLYSLNIIAEYCSYSHSLIHAIWCDYWSYLSGYYSRGLKASSPRDGWRLPRAPKKGQFEIPKGWTTTCPKLRRDDAR